MPVAKIAEVTFTSTDRVRDVIHNFNADGFEALYPKYKGGRPTTFTLPERREIKKIARSKPAEHGLPFSTWSLAKLADYLVAEGVVDDISHEGLRVLLREEGVSFQRIRPGRPPATPTTRPRRPVSSTCMRSPTARSYPMTASPTSCSAWTSSGRSTSSPTPAGSGPSAADSTRIPTGSRGPDGGDLHPPARGQAPARRLGPGQGQALRPHQPTKNRTKFLEFCRYLRSLYPPKIRIAIVLDNFSPHLTTKKDTRVGDWAAANNVKFAYTPTNSSWLNRIEAQFTALRYFALDGTDHASHKEQSSMIRRYIIWRNKHAADERLREVVNRANVA
jgi:transposase